MLCRDKSELDAHLLHSKERDASLSRKVTK
jgi:hypothetical protein